MSSVVRGPESAERLLKLISWKECVANTRSNPMESVISRSGSSERPGSGA